MNSNNKKLISNLIKEAKKNLRPSKFDPNGSYTGLTENGEQPVQDQDDL